MLYQQSIPVMTWLFWLDCQYQYKWLSGKSGVQNDLQCVDRDSEVPCSLIIGLLQCQSSLGYHFQQVYLSRPRASGMNGIWTVFYQTATVPEKMMHAMKIKLFCKEYFTSLYSVLNLFTRKKNVKIVGSNWANLDCFHKYIKVTICTFSQLDFLNISVKSVSLYLQQLTNYIMSERNV